MRRIFPGLEDRVLAMLRGGFECAANPNDLLTWKGAEGCCIGGGIRALYMTWRSSLSESAGETRVHTGISRSTPHVRVRAFEPRQGRIEVEVLNPRRVAIRLPAYARPEESTAWVDGRQATAQWEGRYALFPGLGTGQTAALSYTLPQRRNTYHVAGKEYTADWRGNVVIEMSPRGTHHPTYDRRSHLDVPLQPDPIDRWKEAVIAPILW